jgi:3-oxoacyl-[acyl-carrier-protein] synthase-3
MRGARITAVDYALPARVVTNAEIEKLHPQWRMPEVARRTGVVRRHIASPDETALDLAETACTGLFARLGYEPAKIQALLFCTQTPDHVMPPNANLLQHRLGLRRDLVAFDFSLACSGYVYGLFLAKSMIAAGALDTVLLVTADTYSKLISPLDRGPYTLFGDGAAASLVEPGDEGVSDFVFGTDGSQAGCFIVPAGGAKFPRSASTAAVMTDRSGNRRSMEQISMDGAGVLAFVQREIPSAVESLLRRTEVDLSDIDLVVFHQASLVATDYLAGALRIPPEKLFTNIAELGNTVSASIPIALRDAELQGRLLKGNLVLIVGFGVGLSWGACLLRW